MNQKLIAGPKLVKIAIMRTSEHINDLKEGGRHPFAVAGFSMERTTKAEYLGRERDRLRHLQTLYLTLTKG